MKYLFTLLIVAAIMLPDSLMGQSPKKLYGNAEKLMKESKFDEAVAELTKAIQGDEKYTDAYLLRGEGYEKLNQLDKALADYEKSTVLDPKSPDNFYNTGRLYFKLDKYTDALKFLKESVFMDPKHQAALQYKIFTLIKLSDFQNAIIDCNKALDMNKKNHVLHYCKGVALDSLSDFNNAESEYQTAITLSAEYVKAYNALARVKLKKGNIDEALAMATKAVEKFPNDVDACLTRSIIYRQRTDYANAINDLSKALTLLPDDIQILMTRGQYYFKFGQHQNAIGDFSRVITLNKDYYMAYLWRGTANEEITKTQEAIADYEMYVKLSSAVASEATNLAEINKKLFELKREQINPEITFTDSVVKDMNIQIRQNVQNFVLHGKVFDNSNLKSLKLNEKIIAINKDAQGMVNFTMTLTPDTKEVLVEAVDVYDNTSTLKWKVISVEIDVPLASFLTPFTNESGILYLNSNDPQVYVEGSISDASLIKSVKIDDQPMSFLSDKLNPTFSGTISVVDKQKITLSVCDINNNCLVKEYTINREAAEIAQSNPMGKTWVVFIENSNYETFASIEGPTKDVISMKSALAAYQIHNIIHKKDMTKKEMEQFFQLELRDLVRNNNVNSILVWYAGHGKFINETGYWIPVDAKRDEEFTYFNINSLKASMQSYSKYITHVLVVADACESGPSFYQAMRSTPNERKCDDVSAGKFKSSQVFSSAGYELATDDSQFSKTFAKSLMYNTNVCIPIETIVIKVTEAVGQNAKQKPQFGKIQGFEDEDGTFFFMKK